MWIGLHELEKVHGTSNTEQERQPRRQMPIASISYHEALCQLRQHICRPLHSAESRRQFMDQRHLQNSPQTYDLCESMDPLNDICDARWIVLISDTMGRVFDSQKHRDT